MGDLCFMHYVNYLRQNLTAVNIYCVVQSIFCELVCNLSTRSNLSFHYLLQSIRSGCKYRMVKVPPLEKGRSRPIVGCYNKSTLRVCHCKSIFWGHES